MQYIFVGQYIWRKDNTLIAQSLKHRFVPKNIVFKLQISNIKIKMSPTWAMLLV